MAAKLIHRFKSAINFRDSLALFEGNGGYFLTLEKSNYDKESKEWKTTPFLDPSDLAAIMSTCRQALAYIDANPIKKEKGEGGYAQTTPPAGAKVPNDDDIPF